MCVKIWSLSFGCQKRLVKLICVTDNIEANDSLPECYHCPMVPLVGLSCYNLLFRSVVDPCVYVLD